MEHLDEHTTLIGTLSGTLLSVIATVGFQDIFKAMVMAGVGAIVSFVITKFLKWVWRRIRRR